MFSVRLHGQSPGVDGFDGTYRISFNAGDSHQPTHCVRTGWTDTCFEDFKNTHSHVMLPRNR